AHWPVAPPFQRCMISCSIGKLSVFEVCSLIPGYENGSATFKLWSDAISDARVGFLPACCSAYVNIHAAPRPYTTFESFRSSAGAYFWMIDFASFAPAVFALTVVA